MTVHDLGVADATHPVDEPIDDPTAADPIAADVADADVPGSGDYTFSCASVSSVLKNSASLPVRRRYNLDCLDTY